MNTLKTLFLAELADIYDAEKRIAKALPKMAKAATCNDLKAAFTSHLEETKGHVTKLEEVFACFDLKPKDALDRLHAWHRRRRRCHISS